jgi:Lipid A 3-O-deacylase (PagL)
MGSMGEWKEMSIDPTLMTKCGKGTVPLLWRWGITLTVLAASPSNADDLSKWWLQLGTTDDHHGPMVPVVTASLVWSGCHLGSFDIAPQAFVGMIGSRGGGAMHATAAVPLIGEGVRIAYRDRPFVLNFTPVFNSRTNRNIGGHLNFLSELSYRFHRASISIAHISNASLSRPNRGENMVLFGYEP